MNTRFTFAELLTSPIPHNNSNEEKINYYYNPYQQQSPYQQHWHSMPTNFYTQSLSPPTPQPHPVQPIPFPSIISSPPPPPPLPSQQQEQHQHQQQQQTMTRTRGRRVSNIPNHGIRMFACKTEGCGKVFKRSEHLKRHIRSIHTMEKRK